MIYVYYYYYYYYYYLFIMFCFKRISDDKWVFSFASMTRHYAWRVRRPQLIQRQQTIRHTRRVRQCTQNLLSRQQAISIRSCSPVQLLYISLNIPNLKSFDFFEFVNHALIRLEYVKSETNYFHKNISFPS